MESKRDDDDFSLLLRRHARTGNNTETGKIVSSPVLGLLVFSSAIFADDLE